MLILRASQMDHFLLQILHSIYPSSSHLQGAPSCFDVLLGWLLFVPLLNVLIPNRSKWSASALFEEDLQRKFHRLTSPQTLYRYYWRTFDTKVQCFRPSDYVANACEPGLTLFVGDALEVEDVQMLLVQGCRLCRQRNHKFLLFLRLGQET